jgi:transposase
LRKDHAAAFKQVFRACVLLGKAWGLCGHELGAIDGSKFNAVHNRRRNFTEPKLYKLLEEIDTKIESYLRALDKTDGEEARVPPLTAAALREKMRRLRERKTHDEGLLQEMDSTGQSQVSLTDPDSRAMPKSPTVDVGYNTHVAVDAKHHLFVVPDVINAVTDVDPRRALAIQAKAALEVEQRTVVADMGYDHGEEIKTCEEAGMEPYVATP